MSNPLSDNEMIIVQMLANDKPRKQIADELGVSLVTMWKRLNAARARTGVMTNPALVAKAIREKWIP